MFCLHDRSRPADENTKNDSKVRKIKHFFSTHLDHSVLGRAAALPLEHGVDVGCHGHGDLLVLGGVDGAGARVDVPLSRVFVQFVMIEPLEGRVRVKNHLAAVFLKKSTLLNTFSKHDQIVI